MGDFFTPPSGFPFVPNEPDEPAPKVEDLATSLGIGLDKSGIVGGILAPLFDILMRVGITLLSWALSKLLTIFGFLIRIVGAVDEGAGAGYGQVVAATISNVFGVQVDPSVFATRAGTAGRAQAAQTIGNALIQALFSGVDMTSGNPIQPSDAAVKRFAGTVTQIELSGWLESWVADGVTYHLLEKYGDLKDGIIHAMGISRMSRQAFAPLVKTFLHDPYQYLINNKFRPKPIAEGTALSAFLRGSLDRDQLTGILGPQGYNESDIDYLIDQHRRYLPDADLDYLLARGLWTADQVNTYLQKQGWDPANATTIVQMMQDKRLQPYRQKAVTIATEAYVRGDMDEGSLQSLIDASGLTDEENSWLMTIAKLERQTKVTHLSRGDIEAMILDGLMTFSDLEAWAIRVNMPLDQEKFLELQLLVKQGQKTAASQAKAAAAKAKAEAAQAKLDAAAAKVLQAKAEAADKGLTIAQAEALVKSGDWTFEQLTAFLTTKGYGPDAISGIVTVLHHEIDKAAATASSAGTVKATAAAKGLNLAEVEKGVIQGILTPDELSAFLTKQGFSAADAAVVLAEVQQTIDDNQMKAAVKAAAAAAKGKHSISLQNLARAVKLGITPIATYQTALTDAGFDLPSVQLLVSSLAAEIAATKTAKGSAPSTTPTATTKALTLSQIEQEVIAGVRSIADYTNALKAAGYGDTDQLQLTQLLQDRIDHSQHAAALHFDAVGEATAKGISLSAAEQGVIAGLHTMDDYDALLTQLGYDQVDRDTLEALLMARVATKAAKSGTNAPANPPAP